MEKILRTTKILLDVNINYRIHKVLEKHIYIREDEYFFGKNTTKVKTNLLWSSEMNIGEIQIIDL